MTNPYLHACTDCGQIHNELDTDVHGKDLLIEEDGIFWCRECWKEMDRKRDAEFEAQESAA